MVLDISTDVMEALKKVSAKTNRSPGYILSELVRGPLAVITNLPEENEAVTLPDRTWIMEDGFPVFPSRGGVVTSEMVRKLRDESEDL